MEFEKGGVVAGKELLAEVKGEKDKRNDRIQEIDEDITNMKKMHRNDNKNNCEEVDITECFFRDEDLQELLLYYMKLTFDLKKKHPDETLQNSDENPVDYSVSTDYDSDEEPPVVVSKANPSVRGTSSVLPPNFKCKHCSKILRGHHSLKNHCMRKHGNNDEKNVLCDKCPTRFYTDFEFNRHYQTHNSIKNYLCHLCSKKFVQKSTLELHLRYHKNDRRYQCDVCWKKFFTNNHLKRHCLTHTNRRDYKCEPCDRSFRYKDHLRRHLQSVHIGVRSHSCRECHKSFMYLSQLKFHEQSHLEVPHRCKNCKQTFKKRAHLKVHQRQCKV